MANQKTLSAEEMGKAMREVSVAEFFEKNRHLLGYENPTKALVTILKEIVDNSLDACDEAGILPNMKITIKELETKVMYNVGDDLGEVIIQERKPILKIKDRFAKLEETKKTDDKIEYFYSAGGKNYTVTETKVEDEKVYKISSNGQELKLMKVPLGRFRIIGEDNGPGIISKNVTLAFGKLLYGSKFHRLRQSRGTQGIGISGAILYSQLTTGKPAKIVSKTEKEITDVEMRIDVSKNLAQVLSQDITKNKEGKTGLVVEMEAEARYIERGQSVLEFLKQTAIANPHAKITYDGPGGKIVFERATNDLPKQPKEIKPHPYGVEVGILTRLLLTTSSKNLLHFLTNDFSKIGKSSAHEIIKVSKIDSRTKPNSLKHEDIEKLYRAMQTVKIPSPPTDVLSPMGENFLVEGLKKEIEADNFVAVSRPPTVYRGNPFQVEVGLAYGGKLPRDQTAQLIRFANKVPLLYHQSDCATFEAASDVDWKRYGITQSSGSLPQGPILILIHFASVWVPYTSEGKQAIADYPEIIKEIKLAIQDAGRKLSHYIHEQTHLREGQLRKEIFEKYIPELAESLEKLTDENKQKIISELEKIIKKGVSTGKQDRDKKES
ncbi:MAG: DNA topoisomerase VI subunit B [Candidatus Aenigmarchaeota archaeon]|nr:DNA topoisomerase VI subunit B [Candidatus Aenigmarchaeota archaeon]